MEREDPIQISAGPDYAIFADSAEITAEYSGDDWTRFRRDERGRFRFAVSGHVALSGQQASIFLLASLRLADPALAAALDRLVPGQSDNPDATLVGKRLRHSKGDYSE